MFSDEAAARLHARLADLWDGDDDPADQAWRQEQAARAMSVIRPELDRLVRDRDTADRTARHRGETIAHLEAEAETLRADLRREETDSALVTDRLVELAMETGGPMPEDRAEALAMLQHGLQCALWLIAEARHQRDEERASRQDWAAEALRLDQLREALAAAAKLPGDVDDAVFVDEVVRRIKVATLLEAREAAREARRLCWDQNFDDSVIRHWGGTAGWLTSRAKAIEAGEEPDWPDAAYMSADPATEDVTR